MNDRYDHKTIALHWLTAILIIGLWCVGQSIDWFPSGTPRVWVRSLHILFGSVLALVFAYRLWWRISAGTKLPPASMGWQQTLAKSIHHLLYLLIGATVLLGLFNTWVRGDNLFDLFRLPSFAPGDKAFRHQVEDIHALAANILLGIAALHAAAALVHHFIFKDAVLKRMLMGGTEK
ncbi:cytochrome b [Undibacterium sp. SXout11W]|uniref:cytochrome b n=1 Tax=Undibacterium sp. SXout11W TaxID=3413050 RepID=UPI003BF2B996